MITIMDLIDEYETINDPEVDRVLKRLIVKALSPLQRETYDFLWSQWPEWTPSRDVAKHLGKRLNHAGNLLKFLHLAGLICCDARIENGVSHHYYRVFLEPHEVES